MSSQATIYRDQTTFCEARPHFVYQTFFLKARPHSVRPELILRDQTKYCEARPGALKAGHIL